jgi:hypothetical protein
VNRYILASALMKTAIILILLSVGIFSYNIVLTADTVTITNGTKSLALEKHVDILKDKNGKMVIIIHYFSNIIDNKGDNNFAVRS